MNQLGSGFIYKHDVEGKYKNVLFVITNNHVIENTEKIFLYDGSNELQVYIHATDKQSDIAVLRADSLTTACCSPLEFEKDLTNQKTGHWVMAVGNPFGQSDTVTQGILSYKNRYLEDSPYINYIQTDASINRGNSGGPLINSKGNVIGINNQIWSIGGGSDGMGYCIQSDQAYKIVKKLIEDKNVEWGYLGVQLQKLTESHYNIYNKTTGVIITKVIPESGAAYAMLDGKPEPEPLPIGGLIIGYDKKVINNYYDLKKCVVQTEVGEEVIIKVLEPFEKNPLEFTVRIKKLSNDSIPISIIETLESQETGVVLLG